MKTITNYLNENIESKNINFNPKNSQQLDELLTFSDGDYEKVDAFKANYLKWIKKHNISTDDVDYLCFDDNFIGVNGCISVYIQEDYFKQCKIQKDIANKLCVTSRGGILRLDAYSNNKKFVVEKTVRSIKYDFAVSFFNNFSKLVYNLN